MSPPHSQLAAAAARDNWTSGSTAVPWCIACVIIAALYLTSPNFVYESHPSAGPFAGDFLQEWLGGHIVLFGDHSRFYDVPYAQALQHDVSLVGYQWDESAYLPIVYPPFYYLLVSPFSLLAPRAAAWLWAVFICFCFVGTVMLWRKIATWRPTDAPSQDRQQVEHSRLADALLPWLIPLAVFFTPMLRNLASSQKATVCLLILTATYWLLQTGRGYRAGLVFGLLAFKPQLTLVIAIAMLLKRQGRFVAGGATTGCILVAISLLLGVDVCGQYVQFSTGTLSYLHTSGYDLTKSHCLYGAFSLVNGGVASPPVKLATATAAVLIACGGALVLRGRLNPSDRSFSLQYAYLVVATILLSPHLYTYDLAILVLPMFLLLLSLRDRLWDDRCQRYVAWLLAGLYVCGGISTMVADVSRLQLTTIVMSALLAILVMGRSWAEADRSQMPAEASA